MLNCLGSMLKLTDPNKIRDAQSGGKSRRARPGSLVMGEGFM